MPDDKDIWDDFWKDDPSSDPVSDAVKAAAVRGGEDEGVSFVTLLAKCFPHGTAAVSSPRGPLTAARQVGDHWIGFVGKAHEGAVIWEGFWRQDVSIPWGKAPRARGTKGATIEKAHRVIKNLTAGTIWLGWVHRQVCKLSAEVIKTALHPDNFMADASKAFRAGNDLHMIGADFTDCDDLVVQRLPWRPTKQALYKAVVIFRNGEKIGLIGCKFKEHWRYGASIDCSSINGPMFTDAVTFKKQASESLCPTEDDALRRAETLYARKMMTWLIEHGQNEGLRNRSGG